MAAMNETPIYVRLSELAVSLASNGQIVTQIHTLGDAPALWYWDSWTAIVYQSDDCRVVTEDGKEHRIEVAA
jgi:hypothetical protein